MTTADWALGISIGSLAVAMFSFVWNVWSKFIYPKARIRSIISFMVVFDGDGGPMRDFIRLSATNYGPTDIIVKGHAAMARRRSFQIRRNQTLALINPVEYPGSEIPTGFSARGMPKKLAVGEGLEIYFSAGAPKRWIEKADLFYFGFEDSFGRYHWCSNANAMQFRKRAVEKFDATERASDWSLYLARCRMAPSRSSRWLAAHLARCRPAITHFVRRWK